MAPGEMVWHRKETTHYLGNGRYIVVRPAWQEGWLVEETDPFAGSYLHATYGSRADADLIADALATLHVQPGGAS